MTDRTPDVVEQTGREPGLDWQQSDDLLADDSEPTPEVPRKKRQVKRRKKAEEKCCKKCSKCQWKSVTTQLMVDLLTFIVVADLVVSTARAVAACVFG